MSAHILDGRALAERIRDKTKREADEFRKVIGRKPQLRIYRASLDQSSQVYVKKKQEVAAETGISVITYNANENDMDCPALWIHKELTTFQPDYISRSWVMDHLTIDGIIVQLPIDTVKDPRKIFELIPPDRDVDCLSPENLGLLAQGKPRYPSCTPAGIIRLLDHYDLAIEGQRVLIINDSLIVGRPLAMMMTERGATVTICHKRSNPEDVSFYGQNSDIIVVGVGIPGFLRPEMVRKGAVVLDVGITRMGKSVVGDCDPGVQAVAGYMSRVPGGVGPMTVAMLMENVLRAARARNSNSFDLQ